VVESVRGAVPKFEPNRRVEELGVVLIQAQVFGPELEAEFSGQPSGVGGPVVGSGVEDRAGELAVGRPGSAVEVV
jgi:hypothetical protein